MKLWLERSRSHPLDLFFNTQPSGTSSKSLGLILLTALEHLKSSILQCAEPRCINLTIDTDQSFKNVRLILLELALSRSHIRLLSLTVRNHMSPLRSSHAHHWKSVPLSEMLRGVTALRVDAFYFPWDHPAIQISLNSQSLGWTVPIHLPFPNSRQSCTVVLCSNISS
ncbi:hypothetical protein BOTBODRAFT_568985 [Botryobasidium botryosum FD-172 SS1]|uniref:Uncharacterized protein n=1 Tax=Botryobasidium botryosum (strain FD-172 SS1) TaxID=930990 RepID=A0A067LYM3_BOTB1|nr:hypothetical protein BOTBODRAFT_568985 [Botryobasidium botryosum FD-172 SS1]